MTATARDECGRRRFLRSTAGAVGAAALSGFAVGPGRRMAAAAGVSGSARPSVGLISSPTYRLHATGAGHPESPGRCDAVLAALTAPGFGERLARIDPRPATRDDVVACHAGDYVDRAARDCESGLASLSTGDTAICAKSYEVALLAAGGACRAVDAVMGGEAASVFCVLRPPGHHATADRGMGFCMFNNAAIAARHAQRRHKVGKVLIADWDVHHGNGTQDIFYEDGSVFFFSTHQSPWYPGTGRADETGRGKGLGTTMNCPFPAGAGRKEIVGAFTDRLEPAMQRFRPELVIVSAGFDSHREDPLGQFRLDEEDFAELTRVVVRIARLNGAGRVVSVLEGGYNFGSLAGAAAAHVKALCASARDATAGSTG